MLVLRFTVQLLCEVFLIMIDKLIKPQSLLTQDYLV